MDLKTQDNLLDVNHSLGNKGDRTRESLSALFSFLGASAPKNALCSIVNGEKIIGGEFQFLLMLKQSGFLGTFP